MAKTTTLTNIMARIRNLADTGDSGWMDDTNLTAWINLEYAAFRDLMTSVLPENLATSATQAITANTATYSFPNDFFYLLGIDVLDGSRYYPIEQIMFTERNTYSELDTSSSPRACSFYVSGGGFTLVPSPGWTGTAKIHYVAATTDISAGSPNLDGIDGWESYIIFGVLGHIEGKRGGDPSYWARQQQRVEKRIIDMAGARHRAQPAQVRDLDNEFYYTRRPFGRR